MYDKPLWSERKIQNNLYYIKHYIRKNQNNIFILNAINGNSSLEKKLDELYSETYLEHDGCCQHEFNKIKINQINKFIDFLNGFDLNTPSIDQYEKLELLKPYEVISILQKRKEYDEVNKNERFSVALSAALSAISSTSIATANHYFLIDWKIILTTGVASFFICLPVVYWINKYLDKSRLKLISEEIENNSKYKIYKHLKKLAKEADDFLKFVKENQLLYFLNLLESEN